jgi:hypothetical protein
MNFTYFGSPSATRKIEFTKITVSTITYGTIQVPDGNPEDGNVQLELIRNSLDSDQVTMEQTDINSAVIAFKFTANTLNLTIPAKLTLLYYDLDDNGIVDSTDVTENNLQIFRLDEYTDQWDLMGGEINLNLNTVSIKITRLGTYAVFDALRIQASPSLTETDRLFITPYSPNLNFGYEIEEVKIFSVQGKLVLNLSKDGNNRITWNGKEINGSFVESGLYICKTRNREGKVKYISVVIAK